MRSLFFLPLFLFNFSLFGQVNQDKLTHLADSLFVVGDYIKAKEYCDDLIKMDSTNDYAFFLRGRIHAVNWNKYGALTDFNKAIELNPTESNYYIEKAKFNMNSTYRSLAKHDFEMAIRLEPNNPKIYYYRSQYYELELSYGYALTDINRAISLDSLNNDYKFQKVVVLQKMGKDVESFDMLEIILNSNNADIEHYLYRGILYFEKSEFNKSCSDLHVAESLITDNTLPEYIQNIEFLISENCDTNNLNYFYARANVLFNNEKYDESILMLELGEEKFDKSVLISMFKAILYNEKGDVKLMSVELDRCVTWLFEEDVDFLGFDIVLDYCNYLIAEYPLNHKIYVIRANCYFLMGYSYSAMSDLNYIITLQPDNTQYLETRGLIYIESLNYTLAISDFDKILELDPENSLAYYHRAKCNYLLRAYEACIVDLKQAIVYDSLNGYYYSELGTVYMDMGEFELVLESTNKAIELDSTNFIFYANRGVVKYQLGDLDGSCEDLQTSLSIGEDAPENLSFLYDVKQMINRYCDPSSMKYYFERGLACQNIGEFEEAIDFYNSALEVGEESVLLLISRAKANMGLGKFELAIEDYNTCLEMGTELREELRIEFDNQGEYYNLSLVYLFYYSNLYSSISEAYCGLKDYDTGLIYLNKSIDMLKASYEPEAKTYLSNNYNFYGQIQWAKGDLGLAKSYFKRSIVANPENAVSYFNMAMLILEKQNVYTENKQEVDYDSFFESVKNGTKIITKTQKVKKKSKLLKAKKYCDKAIELEKDFGMAYFVRAQIKILLQEGDYCSDAELAEKYGVEGAVSILEIECE